MNEQFTWGEFREPPSIGSQTRAMSSPDDLQRGHFLSDRGQFRGKRLSKRIKDERPDSCRAFSISLLPSGDRAPLLK